MVLADASEQVNTGVEKRKALWLLQDMAIQRDAETENRPDDHNEEEDVFGCAGRDDERLLKGKYVQFMCEPSSKSTKVEG